MRLRNLLIEYVFYNDVTGFSHGQMDGNLFAYQDDSMSAPLGHVSWSKYNNVVKINFIKSDKDAPLLGVQLLKRLKQEFPREIIDPGMLTDDGSRLMNLIKRRYGYQNRDQNAVPAVGDVLEFLDDFVIEQGPANGRVLEVDDDWVTIDIGVTINWYTSVSQPYQEGWIDIERKPKDDYTLIQIRIRD